MAEIILFHHALGLTDGVHAFADRLRDAGHSVAVPDLLEGATFDILQEGVAHAQDVGMDTIIDRGVAAAEEFSEQVVYAGFSLGALPAQQLAQNRPGALAALFYHGGDAPASAFGGAWPNPVPLQIHVGEQDEWVELDVARELVKGARRRGAVHVPELRASVHRLQPGRVRPGPHRGGGGADAAPAEPGRLTDVQVRCAVMRAMIWNVWWRFGGAWQEREPGIVATLAQVRPDLVGLVETWRGEGTTQPDRLAARLGMAAAYVPASLPPPPDRPEEPSQAGTEMGLGLLSRWPIDEVEVCALPHAQRPGPTPTALLATVAHPHGRLPVIVAGTEWEPHYAGDHLAQCRALAALAADPRLDGDLPVLLLADLNAAVDQPELAPLLEVMVDTWAAGGGDPAAVTLSSAVPEAPLAATKQIDRRIDHVLARPGRTGGTVTVSRAFLAGDRPVDGRYPSDHFAVVVDLAM